MSSEQDIDRELQAALSVSPSPDFEARVLRRVEVDRPSHWRAHYGWLAVAATAILVVGVFYALNRTSSPPAERVPRGGVVVPVRESPVSRTETQKNIPELPRVLAARTQRSAARSAQRTTSRTGEPEIIVPLNQMEAVRRLVRAVNEGRVEPPAAPLQGPLAPPERLAVAPLVVDPIPLPPVGPGAETPAPSIRSLK
jgi:hypothetical protein